MFAGADAVFVGKVVKTARADEAGVALVVRSDADWPWPWKKKVVETRSVTLEVGEAFKGVTVATVEVTSGDAGPGGCGAEFREGESYLVYAYERRRLLGRREAERPKESWTQLTRLKAEADELNAKLPPLATSACLRTERLSSRAEDVKEIRRIVKK